MTDEPLFSASAKVGQHMVCLVADGVSLNAAIERCAARKIKVLSYVMQGDRWIFKCMHPVGGLEVLP